MGRDGVKNLGYSARATLDIPVWDWLSTQHRVRQSEIMSDAARTALTATQRRLIAQLDEFYAEAGTRAISSSRWSKACKPRPKVCASRTSATRRGKRRYSRWSTRKIH